MYWPTHLPIPMTSLLVILAATGAAAAAGIWLFLRTRKKKSDWERERERRLAVNAVGRMIDATLTEAFNPGTDPENLFLLFYRYSVAGVEYSAAQDLSNLRHVVPHRTYSPGEAVIIKYDSHHPSNSIVVCEEWCGLRLEGESGGQRPDAPISLTGS